uniref:CCHC-type domain-containing protein n=1 Tax=Oncorhynchus kisutch TaxID=8019 RepID=A0A8C7KNP7_ONCKI
MAYGHALASCSTRRCRYCGSSEHEARDCAEPKACHGCGSVAHLWRDCQARKGSYASAARGGARAGDGGRKEREEGGGGGGRTAPKESGREEEEAEVRIGTEGEVAGKEGEVVRMEGELVGSEGEVAGMEGEEVESYKKKKKKKKATVMGESEETTVERKEAEEVVEMEPEGEAEGGGVETFGRNVLMGFLGLKVKDVMCLQGNPNEKAFDVTFQSEEGHGVMKRAKEGRKEGPLCHFTVTSLARNNFRVVTVTMYNPHVKDEEVRAFLGRYVDNVSSVRLLRDSLGFWNGRRGFQVLLREDPNGVGGYLHPPAMFSLGADRRTLYYARQPPFCRRCMAYGHILASCNTKKCRFCGSGEHEAKECDEPKACHGCGSSAHLWRFCPARHRSYDAGHSA